MQNRAKRKGGKWATVACPQTRPDPGCFIAGEIHTGQVVYRIMGELKGEIERNEWGKRVENVL
jgi:hypothetical protein